MSWTCVLDMLEPDVILVYSIRLDALISVNHYNYVHNSRICMESEILRIQNNNPSQHYKSRAHQKI